MKGKYVVRKGLVIIISIIMLGVLSGFRNEEYNIRYNLHHIEEIKAMNIVFHSIKNKSKTEYHTKELNKKEEIRKKEEEKQRQQAITQTTPLTQYIQNEGALNRSCGVFYGPNGKETYYNLNMSGVIAIMRGMGNNDEYWIREDGVKMLGDYIMVACHLGLRPRGSLIETSLGTGIVCDTGGFAQNNPTQIDIAVNW